MKTKELSKIKCRACEGIGFRLTKKEIVSNLKEIKSWSLNKNKIEKTFIFKNFKSV